MRVDPVVIRAAAEARATVYPYATWMPIPEASRQPTIRPRLLILHSQAGPKLTSLEALRAYCARDDIHIEPTFILDFDGRMAQLVGILTRADCNAKANNFATSVETQDNGHPTLAITAWSPAQCEQLAGLAAFEHLHPDIRLPLTAADRWDGSGIGPHRQFAEWSVYLGKTCPGDARVAQIPSIIARAIEIAAPPVIPPVVIPPESPDPQETLVEVITNSEPFFGSAPNIWKGVVMPNGKPRHIEMPEWEARGMPAGRPLTNIQLAALFAGGTYSER